MTEIKNPKGAGRKTKITESETIAIQEAHRSGTSKEFLAVQYGVSLSTVQRVLKKDVSKI